MAVLENYFEGKKDSKGVALRDAIYSANTTAGEVKAQIPTTMTALNALTGVCSSLVEKVAHLAESVSQVESTVADSEVDKAIQATVVGDGDKATIVKALTDAAKSYADATGKKLREYVDSIVDARIKPLEDSQAIDSRANGAGAGWIATKRGGVAQVNLYEVKSSTVLADLPAGMCPRYHTMIPVTSLDGATRFIQLGPDGKWALLEGLPSGTRFYGTVSYTL